MSLFEMKLPDVGEGVAEAEIVEWLVAVGDEVTPDTVLAEVLTDKATVEISPPVAGTVVAIYGEPGDVLAVGTNLIELEVADAAQPEGDSEPSVDTTPAVAVADAEPERDGEPSVDTTPAVAVADAESERDGEPSVDTTPPAAAVADAESVDATPPADDETEREQTPQPADRTPRPAGATAAPAVRQRAIELGIDLAGVSGSGPDGRIVHADLDRVLLRGSHSVAVGAGRTSDGSRSEPVRGVRRKIAQRLSATWSDIPHITYVEAVDVTELESLRDELNSTDDGRARLTMLPFILRAIVVACRDQPEINAHYEHDAETLTVHDAVHVGIATQTDEGLLVPVVRSAEGLALYEIAAEISRVADAARNGRASRDELSGSTITITSLGAIGGVVTTPILNAPELAIIGVNKMEVRPVWRDGAFQPRKLINLSSSFDHRMVDGWDAARFVQRLKTLLETPSLLFID